VLGRRILGVGAFGGWNAILEVARNRFPRRGRKNLFLGTSSPSTTPATARSAAACWRPLPLEKQRRLVFDKTRAGASDLVRIPHREIPLRRGTFGGVVDQLRRSVKYGLGVLGTAMEFGPREWGSAVPAFADTGCQAPQSARRFPPASRGESPGSAGGVPGGVTEPRTTSLPTASFCSMVACAPGSASSSWIHGSHRESSSATASGS